MVRYKILRRKCIITMMATNAGYLSVRAFVCLSLIIQISMRIHYKSRPLSTALEHHNSHALCHFVRGQAETLRRDLGDRRLRETSGRPFFHAVSFVQCRNVPLRFYCSSVHPVRPPSTLFTRNGPSFSLFARPRAPITSSWALTSPCTMWPILVRTHNRTPAAMLCSSICLYVCSFVCVRGEISDRRITISTQLESTAML